MNVREMRDKRAKLIADARAMLDKAGGENRDLSAEEQPVYDGLLKEATSLKAQIERQDELGSLELELAQPAQRAMKPAPNAEIGMSPAEVKRYSLTRAIRCAAANNWKEGGLELEASHAVAQRVKKEPRGFYVPHDLLVEKRAGLMTVGTATDGGNVVGTDLLAQSFIDVLRNKMVVRAAGATVLAGLVGNIAIPRQTSATTAYWVAEETAVTTSKAAIDQVTMTPNTVGTYTDLSRLLLLQSSIDVENMIRNDIAKVLAIAIDYACLHGAGTDEPTGVAGVSGIGSVAGGTNGATPTWANIVSLETEVAQDNADIGGLAYITNAKVRGKLKTVAKVTGQSIFIWGDGQQPLNGYPAYVSNQVKSTLEKGGSGAVCSAIFFGNWNDLIIGLWGSLDVLVDPYTNSTKGTVRVVAFQDCDVAVRHAESFAAMLDALTS